MRWQKGVTEKHVYDWRFFSLQDGSIGRLLVTGFLVGLVYAVLIVKVWPGLPGDEMRNLASNWDKAREKAALVKEQMCRDFPDSKACQPASAATVPPQKHTKAAQNAVTEKEPEPRNDGKAEMESGDEYTPKLDVNYTPSEHHLLLTLHCMPFGNRCAEGEEQASVTFESSSSSTRVSLNMPMKASADYRKYLGKIYLGGPDMKPMRTWLILPVGQWHMTAVFAKFGKKASRNFWVSCPPREACVVVDSPIPIQK